MSSTKLTDLLDEMNEIGASDMHLVHNNPIMFRVDTEIVKMDTYVRGSDIYKLLNESNAISNEQQKNFFENNSIDFAYEHKGLRYRGNLTREKGNYTCVMRRLSDQIFTIDQLGFDDFVMREVRKRNGLILVTGATGSGKTTTMTSLINYLNETKKIHISTVEDPIEYVHKPKLANVTQQEVGKDTPSFSVSMRSILRRDPDVVFIGEMRDLETIEMAATAAETGHLVFGTLHTNTAASSIDRITSTFPSIQQEAIRVQLSTNLNMIINQMLIRRVGGGMVPAHEIMIVNREMRAAIRNNKLDELEDLIANSRSEGNILMEESVRNLKEKGIIDPNYEH